MNQNESSPAVPGYQFASDNTAGVCPEALAALVEANIGATASYGDDRFTAQVADRLREIFERDWKLLSQNYNECYHCPTAHPELARLTPYRSATNDLTSGPYLGGPMELDAGIETVSQDGKLVSEPFPGLTVLQRSRVFYYTVFPTLFISAHPDYVMMHVLSRKDRTTTDVACHFLVPESIASSTKVDLSRATELWDKVNRQDWEMCERTQLGVDSPAFRPGPYSSLETMVHAFDQHYLGVMKERGAQGN